MQRALDLASLGSGNVSPNPLVGCVIVCEDRIIGEGWHRKYGEGHAEVNAVSSVLDKDLLKKSTVYVNLEPCAHHGKTPPCADLLIEHEVTRVVVANLDTNPQVEGNGIRKLREAGIEVVVGVCQKEGRWLNRRFFAFVENERPFIILKWAQTVDGFIAHENYESKWISNEASRTLVHRWRSEEDAVLVGTRTAQHDNPKLNVRDWSGRNPVRIVVDRFLRLNDRLNLFDKTQPTLCYNLLRHEEHENLNLIRLSEENFWEELVHDLFRRKLQSIMVEGGAQTLDTFYKRGWWNEARVFHSARSFGKGILAPVLAGRLHSEIEILGDRLSVIVPFSENHPAMS